MSGETNVGSIVGFLRLDATDWNATLAEADAAARRLGQSDPNIQVHADTAAADAALIATQAEADHLDGDDVNIDVNANTAGAEAHMASAKKSTVGLLDAVLLLGPAMVPMAGAAAGLGAAFGGLGAAGVLAMLGIKDAIKAGTVEGQKFQGGINTLTGNLDQLEATAATGIMKPFLRVVDDLQPKMPAINTGIASLSDTLGRVMVPAADGVETAFVKLIPLMTDLAEYAVRGAQAFDAWAHGDGLQKFGGYAMAVLPGVLNDIGQLVELAGRLTGAFAGWGGGVLSILGTLASLLNSLPTGVLTVIATGGLAVYSAFKTFGLLQGLVSGFGGALSGLAANMGRLGATQAASSLRGVASGLQAVGTAGSIASIAVGGIAAVLGVAMFAWSMYKQRQAEAKAAQEAMTQAIQEDSGALGDNAQKVIAKTIADGNMIQKAKDLGISQDTLTSAITGNSDALAVVNQKIHENGMVSKTASGAAQNYAGDQKRLSDSAVSLQDGIGKLNGQISKGKKDYDANKAAAAALAGQLDQNKQKLSSLELAQLSETNATKDQKKAIDSLNQSLDAELSKQLQLQGGLTGIGQARLQMIDLLRKEKASTDLNTDSGLKQRSAIESVVGQLQSYRDTQIKAGRSTADATTLYQTQASELLKTIANTDGANSATYRYAAQLLKLPKDVNTKVGTSGTSVAASQIKGLQGQANKLGATRIEIPTGTPNAKNTAQLLNDISTAALSANKKYVEIPTSTPTALATTLKLKGIDDAAVSANRKYVTIPTKTLNSATTLRQIEDILGTTKDKSMTITARAAQFDHVLGLLGEAHAQAYDQSFTITARYVRQNVGGNNLARHGKGYASGTSSATAGYHPLAEAGAELVLSPQTRYLEAGAKVLNHAQTMTVLNAAQRAATTDPRPSGPSFGDVHVHVNVGQMQEIAQVKYWAEQIPLAVAMAAGTRR